MLPAVREQGSLTSAGAFQLMLPSAAYTVQQLPEVLPLQFFFEKSWRDSHKMLLVAILLENLGNSIEKSASVLGMGSEQPVLVVKLSAYLST